MNKEKISSGKHFHNVLCLSEAKGMDIKMIREFQIADTAQVMNLWLLGNMDAHSFIQEEYWISHFDEVQEALLQAKVFVYELDGKIQGFIGLMSEYIAGIFVDKSCRSTGIGTQLLNYVKQKYPTLSLSVYRKNLRAVAFYQKEGFAIQSEGVEKDTGEIEYTMLWKDNFTKTYGETTTDKV